MVETAKQQPDPDKPAEVREGVVIEGYRERNDFVPNPTDMRGTLDTSGTAGAAHNRLEDVTAAFEVAKRDDTILAGRALDPQDTAVPSSTVVLPQSVSVVSGDPDAARDRVRQAAEQAKQTPAVISGETLSAREAREAAEQGKEPKTEPTPGRDDTGAASRKRS